MKNKSHADSGKNDTSFSYPVIIYLSDQDVGHLKGGASIEITSVFGEFAPSLFPLAYYSVPPKNNMD